MSPQQARDAALIALYAAEDRFKARGRSTGWDRVVVASYRANYTLAERALAKAKERLDYGNGYGVK